MKSLLRLYPREWRERYEEEVASMLDDSGAGLRDAPDLVRGALDAHIHPGPLGLPSRGLRGWLSSERGVGLAAITAGSVLLLSYLALMVFDGQDAQRTDFMRYVAPMALAGPFAAFAIAGLVARQVSQRRDRIIAAAAVALVGGRSLGIIAVVLFSVATQPMLNRTNNVLVACAIAVLLGALVGVVAMWECLPVARRWLAVLSVATVLDLVFVTLHRLDSFTTAAQAAATSWLGTLLGVAWIGIGASVLQLLRRDATAADRSGLSASWGRRSWPIVVALVVAGCVIYLGIWSESDDVSAFAIVALWLTPVAVAWRAPDVTAARPLLVPALMLVALPATVLDQVTSSPFAPLSLLHNGIALLMLVTSAVGYTLVGRELLHLSPTTRKRRGLFAMISGLSVVGPVATAFILLPLFDPFGPKWRYHALEAVLAITVALAMAFALWAPVASTLSGTEPHRFWRPLALLLPVTLVASVADTVLTQMAIALGENDLYVPVLWISRIATVAGALLWLFAFGWHVPGARSADSSVAEAVATT